MLLFQKYVSSLKSMSNPSKVCLSACCTTCSVSLLHLQWLLAVSAVVHLQCLPAAPAVSLCCTCSVSLLHLQCLFASHAVCSLLHLQMCLPAGAAPAHLSLCCTCSVSLHVAAPAVSRCCVSLLHLQCLSAAPKVSLCTLHSAAAHVQCLSAAPAVCLCYTCRVCPMHLQCLPAGTCSYTCRLT